MTPLCTDTETEVQRGSLNCPQSQSKGQWGQGPSLNLCSPISCASCPTGCLLGTSLPHPTLWTLKQDSHSRMLSPKTVCPPLISVNTSWSPQKSLLPTEENKQWDGKQTAERHSILDMAPFLLLCLKTCVRQPRSLAQAR